MHNYSHVTITLLSEMGSPPRGLGVLHRHSPRGADDHLGGVAPRAAAQLLPHAGSEDVLHEGRLLCVHAVRP